jgi:hypothetical protein
MKYVCVIWIATCCQPLVVVKGLRLSLLKADAEFVFINSVPVAEICVQRLGAGLESEEQR